VIVVFLHQLLNQNIFSMFAGPIILYRCSNFVKGCVIQRHVIQLRILSFL